MPATALDPRTALVVIDLQKGILGVPSIHPVADVVARTALLVRAFHARGLPVIFVTVSYAADGGDQLKLRTEVPGRMRTPPASDFAELVPELGASSTDIRVVKRNWGAFHGTDLDLQLRRRQVTGIVLTGVATSIGVDTTARGAHEHGYNLTFATDAMTDLDASAHEVALTKIFPRLGETDTTERILALLRSPRPLD